MTFTHKQVVLASREYFDGDNLAATVFANKYALKQGAQYHELTPDDMHIRLAKEFARIEAKYPNPMSYEEIYGLLANFRYIIPQGSPMAGIGNPFQVTSLSNCFVIDPAEDSYGGIMRADEEQVQLMKRRGGVGHDLSNIRPKGTPVNNSAGTSTGIVPYMERFSNSTREVAQDGRRGALMLSISVHHPDAPDFITAKQDRTSVTGANVSVRVSDEFMQALNLEEDFVQRWTNGEDLYQEIADPQPVWRSMMEAAWASAEPGVLFWDTILKESPADCYDEFQTSSTNPCGEIPLSPNDACRLLAINLYSYISDPFQSIASFNYPLFESHVGKAMKMMDDIVDLEVERINQIIKKVENSPESDEIKSRELELWTRMRKAALDGRRTGLGHTGGADAMAALGLTYGTEEANAWFEVVQRILSETAYRKSTTLANERGAFPVYDSDREEGHPFLTRVGAIGYPRRNVSILTIAPTGTTSLMAQTSSGIEPVFMLAYKRRRKVNPNDPQANITFVDEVGDSWEEYNVVHHKFMDYLGIKYGYTRAQIESFSQVKLDKLIAASPYAGATANEIDPLMKVKMQGRMQKWVDHSISVTINLPEDVTVEEVDDIYRTAYTVGCKGMTIYREGSRSGVLVSNEDTGKNEGITENHAPKRPERLPAIGHEFPAMDEEGEAKHYVVMFGMMKDKPYEVFLLPPGSPIIPTLDPSPTIRYFIDKVVEGDKKMYNLIRWENGEETTLGDISRATSSKFYEYGKQVSAMLRHGMPLPYLAKTLRTPLRLGGNSLFQYQNRLANAIETFIPDGSKGAGSCANCGSENVVYQEGCLTCHDCGSSKCG